MTGGIFLIQEDQSLVRMDETAYDSEDLLQTLLEDYPDLLAGDQIESEDPRRWLLVRREMGVPGEDQGGNRWSIDHLFLDQDAIPTLVEVKRSTDTRLRREVVGQMLDYAANAVAYWPVEQIRAQFETYHNSKQLDPDAILKAFLRDSEDVEQFWQQVKTNLQAGKIRMVFVADEIPDELKRIVEFLNEQLDPAQVLAVEIKQYVGKNLQSLVPRVIGQTSEAKTRKGGARKQRDWDEDTFFAELERRSGTSRAHVAKKIYDWVCTKTNRFYWGKGIQDGSVYPILDDKRGKQRLFILWTYGRIHIPFEYMKTSEPFSDRFRRLELIAKLDEIDGVDIPAEAMDGWPTLDMISLDNREALEHFIETMEWAVTQIRQGEN